MFKTLKSIEKPFAGGTLSVTQFPVLRAIRIGTKIAKLAGPVLAGLGQGINMDDLLNGDMSAKLKKLDIDLNKAIPQALNALATTLDPDEFAALCQELLSGAIWTDGKTAYELGQTGTIDMVMGGSIGDLFAALRMALEANDFFGLGAIGKLRGMLAAPKPPSPEPSPQN